jgi:SAM-dependent methyltransferase
VSQRDAVAAWRSLVSDASAPYRRSGRFAWHFARGKLRWDPVFGHLLARGVFAPRARVLDIGCGQALLASLLAAAGAAAREGRWPSGWAAPPLDVEVRGIELHARDVARAHAALGAAARVACADMRSAALPSTDTVVLLDVLHYVSEAEQDALLARVRAALPAGGTLVLRVGDASARRGFAASRWVDGAVAFARGKGVVPIVGRTLAAWRAHLEALGFSVTSEPMRSGTPFANVLLVGTLAGARACRSTSAA